MSSAAVMTAVVLSVVLMLLNRLQRAPDVVMWGGVAVLLIIPVPDPAGWQVGVIDARIRETGALNNVVQRLLGAPASQTAAQHRLVWPSAVMSGFLNNTPLVAMLLPAIDDWARRNGISVSKLLLPLSYAAILGGGCTLVGTSTNLIINGWLIDKLEHPGLGMFAISIVAVPIAIIGILFTVVAGRWLLVERKPVFSVDDDARHYTVEMMVERDGDLIGQSIEAAGLRGLPGLFLIEIDRDGEVLAAVSPNVRLRGGDRLVFAGVIDSVLDLQRMGGLGPATNQVFKLDEPRHNRALVEAVVSDTCPLVGKTIREGRFRTVYNAAVIAVARNNEKIGGKIGDIRLQAGDTLLLEARAGFAEQQRNRRDFYLVSKVDTTAPGDSAKAPLALGILVAMIASVAIGLLSMLQAGMAAATIMLVSRCCDATAVQRSIDWQVVLVIAAALGLGNAMESSGLADFLGSQLQSAVGDSPTLMLAAIYAFAMVLASVITAKAAAVLVLPMAVSAAAHLQVSYMPYVIAVMIASATSVATPMGYPTNLMVYGPGGYKFSDYVKMGVPLSLIIWAMAVYLIPMVWPFAGSSN
jgi:di/tricarboxylate transporter